MYGSVPQLVCYEALERIMNLQKKICKLKSDKHVHTHNVMKASMSLIQ
jgi:hypothetical protein